MKKHTPDTLPKKTTTIRLKRPIQRVAIGLMCVLSLFAVYRAYVFFVTPAAIRQPQYAHYHFRLQILVNGQAENFAAPKYQTPYNKGLCSGELSKVPIHFHDNKNQIVHIHWQGVTGGMLLKNYGWNYVDGPNNVLGYKLDDVLRSSTVPIHGKILPAVPKDATFWIYTGDLQHYHERSFADFKTQELESFLKTSAPHHHDHNHHTMANKLLGAFFPKVAAHGGVDDDHPEDEPVFNSAVRQPAAPTPQTAETEKQLIELHNLAGNVVIFVQSQKPSEAQIKDRFAHLEPLSESVCGG